MDSSGAFILSYDNDRSRHDRDDATQRNMAKSKATVRYGKRSTRTKAERMFAELPQSPVRKTPVVPSGDDAVDSITKKLSEVHLEREGEPRRKSPRKSIKYVRDEDASTRARDNLDHIENASPGISSDQHQDEPSSDAEAEIEAHDEGSLGEHIGGTWLRTLSWDDVCPPGDCIDKIAEASYAEVYRVTNERGTSVIKVIRLPSPIKPQTKTQIRSRLVDEEPHSEEDVNGELQISEWLADIPGFVVYKERYLVKGKTSRALLETHQAFQRRLKRRDAGRAQFYPSPSRYLDDTKFLVVELGDAGVALEDWDLTTDSQLWDIFFLEAIALARAEEVAMFEVRALAWLAGWLALLILMNDPSPLRMMGD